VVVWLKKHLPEQQAEQLPAAVVAAPFGRQTLLSAPTPDDEPHPPEPEEEEPPELDGIGPGVGHCETRVPPMSLAKAAQVLSMMQAWPGGWRHSHMDELWPTQHGYLVWSQLATTVPAPPGWAPQTSAHCVPATTTEQVHCVADGWLGQEAGPSQQHQLAPPPPLLDPAPQLPPPLLPPLPEPLPPLLPLLPLPAELHADWVAPHSPLPQQTP
jgi:hypothetical protein